MTKDASWDPGQYLRYQEERQRPARELLARVPLASPRRVVDLGCGAGDVTALLAERWPEAEITGVDSSPEMLSRAHEVGLDKVRWLEADAARWTPERCVDLIYSNAALHWLDDHERLFPRLLSSLEPGGVFAVQMPLSWRCRSHAILREILETGAEDGTPLGAPELRERVAARRVASARWYHRLLAPLASSLDVWETEYLQVLEGPRAVLEWVRGTALRPVLAELDRAERERFLERYTAQLDEAYPPGQGGRTLYPFPRLFIVAVTA